MKKRKISFIILFAVIVSLSFAQTIEVINQYPFDRTNEIIEIDASEFNATLNSNLVITDQNNQEVPYQLIYNGKESVQSIIFPVTVKTGTKEVYTLSKGTPKPIVPKTFARFVPERKDDFAWENDMAAYRVYGPALQKSGEKSYGIDVWTKNSKELDMASRYYKDYEGNITGWANAENGQKNKKINLNTSFHLDHGDGLDCYAVGATLGCGAPALMVDGNLVLPYCYKTYKILDNGPLRFTVELTFNPTRIGNDENVVEHRIVSLDKGSNFNRMTVWYEGLSKPRDLAAGVVIHSADKESVVIGNNFVQYADPTDQPKKYGFQLYVAALFPNGAATQKLMYDRPSDGVEGHAIGIKRGLKNNERYSYFFGSAWSEYDVRSQAEWQIRINDYMSAFAHPLLIEIK